MQMHTTQWNILKTDVLLLCITKYIFIFVNWYKWKVMSMFVTLYKIEAQVYRRNNLQYTFNFV